MQILNSRGRGRFARAERPDIVGSAKESQRQCEHRASRGQRQALIEYQIRVRLILAAGRMRDQRDGADAEHLGDREDDEHHVAGGSNACNRGISQAGHKIQVDEKI